MKRLTLALAFVAAVFAFSPTASASGGGGCHRGCTSTSVGTDTSGLFASLGLAGKDWNPSATSENPPAGGYIQYKYSPPPANTKYNRSLTCANCLAPAGAAAACVGNQVAVLVAERRIGAPAVWANQGTIECLTPTEQIGFDPAELQAMVDNYFQRIPLPEPGLHISPADNAVVNLPEIISADAPGATTFTVNEVPFPTVTIKATVRWEWDFGDGGSLSTASPGQQYSAANPDIGDYLTHTYLTANEAWPIAVTSVWTGTYTVVGTPGTRTVTGAVQRTSTVNLASADYGSTLTGN